MPTISLRLTEEEHAALKAWAHDSRRSIQKEAVWRLFADPSGARNVTATRVISPSPFPPPPDLTPGARDDVTPYFKPDPKPARK